MGASCVERWAVRVGVGIEWEIGHCGRCAIIMMEVMGDKWRRSSADRDRTDRESSARIISYRVLAPHQYDKVTGNIILSGGTRRRQPRQPPPPTPYINDTRRHGR